MSIQVPAILDAKHRRCFVESEPMILHCHHYNTFLQQTIQDAAYVDSRPFLIGAANEVAFGQLSALFKTQGIDDVAERKRWAEEVFRWAGFGRFSLEDVTDSGGEISTPHSHYSHAWLAKFGKAEAPVDFFTTGYLTGALAAIYETEQGHFSGVQEDCLALGADKNRFRMEAGGANYTVFTSPGAGALTDHKIQDIPASPVDYEGIFSALTGMEIAGDETGAIPAFGVYLTRHYANYYNRISFEFTKELINLLGSDGAAMAEPLLVEAGHVCAFNTFGGIMNSPEWDALIKPTLVSKDDWVHGMVAAVNALGWGRWQVTELSPTEAVFVLHDDYESVGHLAEYGKTDLPVSHLARGAVMGIMDLVYIGEVHEKPAFTPEFYDRLFKSDDSYDGEQLKNRAAGDEVTAFRVHRG